MQIINFRFIYNTLLHTCKIKMSTRTTRSDTTGILQINDENVDHIFLCDKSDTEEALISDEEDLGLLQQDVEHLEANNKAKETIVTAPTWKRTRVLVFCFVYHMFSFQRI